MSKYGKHALNSMEYGKIKWGGCPFWIATTLYENKSECKTLEL